MKITFSLLLLLLLSAGCEIPPPPEETWNPMVAPPLEAAVETSSPVRETGPLALSVEEAAVLALAGNRDLAARRLTPEIVGAFEEIERARFDPELFAAVTAGREESVETARATGGRFSVEGQTSRVEGGGRILLPTGTGVELGVSEARSDSNRTPDQHQVRVGLTVTQALLRGFGPGVNLVAVRQAEMETLASLYELRGFAEALLAETEIAYWNLALAHREIEIFTSSLALARRQEDEIAQQIEVGLLPMTEVAASRAEIARREQALIDAHAALQEARLRLLRIVNEPFERTVRPTSDFPVDPLPLEDVESHIELADRWRPDLNEARLRVEQNRLETVVTKNGLLPRLDLFLALGKSGYAGSFLEAAKNIDEDSYDVAAGVDFSWFLSRKADRARHRAALTTTHQARAAVENLRQLVRLDVRLAANEVERALRQITASAATRRLQEETLRAEEERSRVGSSTSLLVAQAQRDLLGSQIAEVEAVVAYRIAIVRLYLAEGTLLDRRGIVMVEPDEELR